MHAAISRRKRRRPTRQAEPVVLSTVSSNQHHFLPLELAFSSRNDEGDPLGRPRSEPVCR